MALAPLAAVFLRTGFRAPRDDRIEVVVPSSRTPWKERAGVGWRGSAWVRWRQIRRRFSMWNRRRKADVIRRVIREERVRSILLVGVVGEQNPQENIVEREITQDAEYVLASGLAPFAPPVWKYVRADGLRLPFRDGAFDLVLSNAVIEHVGDETAQRQFAAEHARVGRVWVLTTPNRLFPVESHTGVLLLHWRRAWRSGRREFGRLLTKREFQAVLPPGTLVRGAAMAPTLLAVGRQPDRPV